MLNRILATLTFLLCTATLANAQGSAPRQRNPDYFFNIFMKVASSLEQQQSFFAIRQKIETEFMKKFAAEIQASANATDTAVIRASSEKRIKIQNDGFAEMEKEMLKLLTPEQQTRYTEIKAEQEKTFLEQEKLRQEQFKQDSLRKAGSSGK